MSHFTTDEQLLHAELDRALESYGGGHGDHAAYSKGHSSFVRVSYACLPGFAVTGAPTASWIVTMVLVSLWLIL